jgi:ribosome-binding factor A
MSAHYKARLESHILELLGDLLEREAYDPRLEGVVVTGVELNEDNSVAKIFTMGGGEDAGKGLRKASSFLRAEIGRQLKLRSTPLLRFHEDRSLDRYNRIERILTDDPPAADDPPTPPALDGEDREPGS